MELVEAFRNIPVAMQLVFASIAVILAAETIWLLMNKGPQEK